MNLWRRIFAAGYDTVMSRAEKAGLGRHRQALVSRASGRVLEIGGGTGANLPYYRDDVDVVITEPEEPMARRLGRKLYTHRPVCLVRATAEDLPFKAESFDYVVSTLVLCTVKDPVRALGELQRVLKPKGQLLFLEHVRSNDDGVARWQDRLHGIWVLFGAGCHCNRRTLVSLRQAGFSLTILEHGQIPKVPPIVRPLIVGAAERP
jgi:ubiquinone/menaquinone biosynthesis C-methylase UbiE